LFLPRLFWKQVFTVCARIDSKLKVAKRISTKDGKHLICTKCHEVMPILYDRESICKCVRKKLGHQEE
jgi:hypothetical protein